MPAGRIVTPRSACEKTGHFYRTILDIEPCIWCGHQRRWSGGESALDASLRSIKAARDKELFWIIAWVSAWCFFLWSIFGPGIMNGGG